MLIYLPKTTAKMKAALREALQAHPQSHRLHLDARRAGGPSQ